MNPDTNSNFGYSIISTNVQFQPKTPKLMKKNRLGVQSQMATQQQTLEFEWSMKWFSGVATGVGPSQR